jgi:2-polyprenyl-3-methyl-5-hydroxy-6-metoxy-1,4-benzoquinol methylase
MIYESINIPLWRALRNMRGLRILDVGCGTGALGALLQKNGNRVEGITCSANEARIAAGRLERAHVLDLNDCGRVAAAVEGSFDALLFADVLEHLPDPQKTLAALLGRLAPGGRVYVSLPNVACFYVRLGLLFGRFDYSPDGGVLDETHLRLYTLRTARKLLREAGLRIIATGCVPAPSVWFYQTFVKSGAARGGDPRPMSESKAFQLYERWIYPVERGAVFLWRGLLANQFVFTCERA